MQKKVEVLDRFRGCLVGLAAGDALGTTIEFRSPGTFKPLNDIVGGGPFGLEPGQWTDDTSMALCLADSLLASNGFDADDQMRRYVRWWREGYRSSTGRCFDIGGTVQSSLQRFEATGNPLSGSTDAWTAGNGSLMRLAPVPMRYFRSPERAIRMAADSSRTTHGAAEAVDACRYFAGLLIGALRGVPRKEILKSRFRPGGTWQEDELAPEILRIASGSFKEVDPPEIRGTGYVVQSLEAALWAFHTAENFRDGCLRAVNLGEDADTTGAIYGQIAGAYWGLEGIPSGWRTRVALLGEIVRIADKLHQAATG